MPIWPLDLATNVLRSVADFTIINKCCSPVEWALIAMEEIHGYLRRPIWEPSGLAKHKILLSKYDINVQGSTYTFRAYISLRPVLKGFSVSANGSAFQSIVATTIPVTSNWFQVTSLGKYSS